ncbi:MAG: methionyl-tRNA formyltransferase [Candidatus Nealsonbacteria bacterium CG_4_10_14_0_2_um_filter_40_15]|uniref:Methionyl-tRNA formyltransferase n=1 Tax=Candidatus Nealsonbacteria bacterium CG_4_10_14_0_2_um_filter_40_15 TaxID=1974682 RepID=A0A2M7UU16_9BACT|nr:MAG: methionyl-tRNA formyltransferase [Candidatus Nealsonbacteria bacterium CG_4_10_14_0_2_um_filter_40_15]
MSLKIIFMGTPKFGAIILEKLADSRYKPILVVTETDKPVGRKKVLTPPPVKVVAEKYEIPVLQPEKIRNSESEIRNLKPDLIIVAAYGKILPEEILEIPKYGCLNVHPSLLPRWRGPSPVQFAILNGDTDSGVTIMKIAEKVDAGPVLIQRKLKLEGNETYDVLHDKLGEMGGDLLIEIIPEWITGKIDPQLQDESRTTYTRILKKEDGKIDWEKSAEEIERQIRAFNLWPGIFTFWEKSGKLIRIKILKARVLNRANSKTYPIGKTLVAGQNELCVQTGKGFLIIERLQLEGKKETDSEDLLRGYSDFIGTILK